MSAPVMVMAGGTGGHVFPGLAVAAELRQCDVQVVWLGAEGGMESQLVPRQGITFHGIRVQGVRGKSWRRKLRLPLDLLAAFLQARRTLRRERPRSVLSMGGYAAGPGGLAAAWLRVPLLVHEQNRIPGLTNRVLSRLAQRTFTGFPDAFAGRAEFVGNPVRAEIAAIAAPAQRLAGRDGALRLLVLGGSQGARALNQLLPQALALLPVAARPEVWHQCGARMLAQAQQAYREAGVDGRVQVFVDDMAAAYAWADLVVCRSGALTLAEIAASGSASLLVPYPHAVDDHQTANARWLVDLGAAELWPEATLNAMQLAQRLQSLGADRTQLLGMAQAARNAARTGAAARVAQACLEYAR